MDRFLYIVLIVAFLFSCINMNDPKSQADYIECRSKFDESLVKLFPDRLPNTMLGFGFAAPYEDIPGRLELTMKYSFERDYVANKAKYVGQSKHYKKSNDECLFLVNQNEVPQSQMCQGFYPIPEEAILESDSGRQAKMKTTDSDVYIIDLKAGDFLKDNQKHTRQQLPENWSHGYSTGVTTNDRYKTIQIWLVVW
ncbi:MAG: hypothetical protein HOP30_10990 [Cyclobacteriaceae bacterium]|nr:hypothetical protein [Cyclobacteriaceae bacterium]